MWVNTRWNGKKLTTGFTEGGFSVIDRREIEKFLHIMKRWEELFQCSPEEFYLTRRNNSREYRQKEGVLVRKRSFRRTEQLHLPVYESTEKEAQEFCTVRFKIKRKKKGSKTPVVYINWYQQNKGVFRMNTFQLYSDIKARTKGEIYIGVVGPVRTGKSYVYQTVHGCAGTPSYGR